MWGRHSPDSMFTISEAVLKQHKQCLLTFLVQFQVMISILTITSLFGGLWMLLQFKKHRYGHIRGKSTQLKSDLKHSLRGMNPFPPCTLCFTLNAVFHTENDGFLQARKI